MKNSPLRTVRKAFTADFWRVARIEIIGIFQDFWKDAPAAGKKPEKPVQAAPQARVAEEKNVKTGGAKIPATARPAPLPRWHADRFQIMEKIWGEGRHLPSPEELEQELTAHLGLNENTFLLDLSAGLGGLARDLCGQLKTAVAGLETDAIMARRAMSLTLEAGKDKKVNIETYDPANFSAARKYDAIVARELFYRVIGKEKFFQAINLGLKQHGYLAFTDYIMEKNARDEKAVAAWIKHEPNALPLSLREMTDEWLKLKYDVRISEDITEIYRREISERLKDFAAFLAKNPPDNDTRALVLQETESWARRAEAMRQGLKVYRFEMIKM